MLPLLILEQLAFIVGFGVLLDTFVVRSLTVPAAVHLLGERTWWPGRPAARRRDSRTGSSHAGESAWSAAGGPGHWGRCSTGPAQETSPARTRASHASASVKASSSAVARTGLFRRSSDRG